MANKYIIEGAAFNGDGTSPDVATSNGGVGAWNTITYFEGATPAYGSIAAGDTVYIRSKTAAGADITRIISASASVGSANATATDHVKWILDGGTIWTGVSGVLTYQTAGTTSNWTHTLRSYNSIYAEVRGTWVYYVTHVSATGMCLSIGDACDVKNVRFDFSAQTTNGSYIGSSGASSARFISCDLKIRSRQSGFGAFGFSDYSNITIVDTNIELTSVLTNAPVFRPGALGGKIEVLGGAVYGAGATTNVPLAQINGTTGGVFLYGTDIPKTMSLTVPGTTSGNNGILEMVGVDGGAGSALADRRWGEMDSRTDGYYPTLNAFLPTTTQTPWSWKVWPNKTTRNIPFKVPSMKLYTGDAGVKTLTCNFLIADSILGADTESTWLEVQYIDDATGLRKHIDTRTINGSPLATSAAPWSATTYGAVNLLKRQIQVTTPTAVKKDTLVIATLRSFVNATSANDLMFICPDVVMT